MEPLHEVELLEINYMERLKKELDSCCLPSIKDLSKATTDEITRDTYRVLTGNGNITGGLVVKIATANVNIQNLREHITSVATTLNSQVRRCNDFQVKSANRTLADNVRNQMIRKTISFMWENKGFIGAVILGIGMIVNVFTVRHTATAAAEERATTEQLVKQLDAKVTSIARIQGVNKDTPSTPRTP